MMLGCVILCGMWGSHSGDIEFDLEKVPPIFSRWAWFVRGARHGAIMIHERVVFCHFPHDELSGGFIFAIQLCESRESNSRTGNKSLCVILEVRPCPSTIRASDLKMG